MIHGVRATYQAQGCRCLPCRASEATYRANLRRQHAKGIQPLGARISAQEAGKIIRALLTEQWSKAQIARELGLKTAILQLKPDVITVRNLLKLRKLARERLR